MPLPSNNHLQATTQLRANPINEDDRIILVMGPTGAGKSTFIQELTGYDTGIGQELKSESVVVTAYPYQAPGRSRLIVVDTPGFSDGERSDAVILGGLGSWLAGIYEFKLVPAAILCMYRVTDRRWTIEHRRNFALFCAIWGAECFNRVCFVTTMWPSGASDLVAAKRTSEQYRDYWAEVIGRGAKVHAFDHSRESAIRIVESMCKDVEGIVQVPLQIQTEVVTKKMRLDETYAGRLVGEDLKGLLTFLEEQRRQDRAHLAAIVARKQKKKGRFLKLKDIEKEDRERRDLEAKIQRHDEEINRRTEERSLLSIRLIQNILFMFRSVFARAS